MRGGSTLLSLIRILAHLLNWKGFCPPSLKLVIVNDLIIDELEVVRGNGEQQRHIERLENIIFYQHIAMIVIPLPVQLLDFRVNGNDGIRKLVTRGQVINECIFADHHFMAGAAFIPPLGIPCQ